MVIFEIESRRWNHRSGSDDLFLPFFLSFLFYPCRPLEENHGNASSGNYYPLCVNGSVKTRSRKS